MNPDFDLIARLRNVHPPAEPSWWPPAPGWWLATVVLVALGVALLRFGMPVWRAWRLRCHFRKRLARLRVLQARTTRSEICAELSKLLREIAIARFSAQQVAGLSGHRWLEFVKADNDGTVEFADAVLDAPYRRCASGEESETWFELTRLWIARIR